MTLKKVLWIQDMDPNIHNGGAQITDYHMIEYLKNSWQIDWCNNVEWLQEMLSPSLSRQEFDNRLESEVLNYDLAIVSNARYVSNYSQRMQLILKTSNVPFIKYEHDHACKWQAFFPMNPRCQRNDCPSKLDFGWIYQDANAIIYLSPLQQKMHEFWNGYNMKQVDAYTTPPYIPYDVFEKASENTIRDETKILIMAGMYRFKGYRSNIQYARKYPEFVYHHYGNLDYFKNDARSEMESVGIQSFYGINHDKIPKLMASYGKLLHLSDGFLPFERVTLEAFFAGCEVITNKNVGSTSYDWWGNYNETIEAMDNTRQDFAGILGEYM